MPSLTPIEERLVAALREAKAPEPMIRRAQEGYYGDFTSPLPNPISTLCRDCEAAGLHELALRAMSGEFDG